MFIENYGYKVADFTHGTPTPVTKGIRNKDFLNCSKLKLLRTLLHIRLFTWVPQWFGTSIGGLSAEEGDHSLTICLPTFHVILFAHIQ